MKRLIWFVAVMLFAGCAAEAPQTNPAPAAANTAPMVPQGARPGDVPLTAQETRDLLSGKTYTFDRDRGTYAANQAFIWNGAHVGGWRIREDGELCIDNFSGPTRCYRFVRSGDDYVMISPSQRRWPLRPAS
jgi:Ni/Co efflux regulator RcnB